MKKTERDFASLFLEPTLWIDVRAPIEYLDGKIPGALNLPLLNDEERHTVGLTYKNQGSDAAVALGHKIVSGDLREMRIREWLKASANEERAVIYCFRGGLRSQTVQKWLAERNVERPIVAGGFKALRRFLLRMIAEQSARLKFEVVSGPTGSGKTAYLHASGRPYLDLEALAMHRGSAFGRMEQPQPSQVDFENQLAIELLRLSRQDEPILVENESRLVGHRVIPAAMFEAMKRSPKIQLQVALEARVENIFTDYILNSRLGLKGDPSMFAEFRQAVQAISRKLGGLRTQDILHDLEFSHGEFLRGRGLDSNREWIRKLLVWYYDPGYLGK